MTKFLQKSFSVAVGDSAAYRNNWDAIFGNKDVPVQEPSAANGPQPSARCPFDCHICDAFFGDRTP